ncbi:MAG: response regulator [Dehalococcoidales bacterium]|nr:response regulator [Dehalococcoidales bacterium]
MTRKMLIVDDEESILTLLATIFGHTDDYTILCARDGEEALKVARADNPDIILLDNRLPGISGLEVCGTVKSDPTMSHIKVLILSCQGQNFDWQKAREMGADSYITKPFSSTALVKKVAELLGNN